MISLVGRSILGKLKSLVSLGQSSRKWKVIVKSIDNDCSFFFYYHLSNERVSEYDWSEGLEPVFAYSYFEDIIDGDDFVLNLSFPSECSKLRVIIEEEGKEIFNWSFSGKQDQLTFFKSVNMYQRNSREYLDELIKEQNGFSKNITVFEINQGGWVATMFRSKKVFSYAVRDQ